MPQNENIAINIENRGASTVLHLNISNSVNTNMNRIEKEMIGQR